ncbi:MAG: DUF63 family protein [Methanobrevibacter sp.]|jgi:uncharacterized membrane protein|nr:DUF63 family protein [Candidatus Methanoflexus mossambicus]
MNSYLIEFLEQYFFSGYTLFNTIVYGLILIIFILILIKGFKKLKIIPSQLIFAVIPFILIGSLIRALVDNSYLPYSWFLITPGIYFIVGFLTIVSMLIGLFIEKKIKNSAKIRNLAKKDKFYKYLYDFDFRKIMVIIAIIVLVPIICLYLKEINITVLTQLISIWLILTFIFYLIGFKIKIYNNKMNLSIISAHLLDATTTFLAVDFYGYSEQHVLPNLIYSHINSAISIYPLKIIVISLAIYTIDEYIDDETIKGMLKLAIFILGLAPGLRNLLTMIIGLN